MSEVREPRWSIGIPLRESRNANRAAQRDGRRRTDAVDEGEPWSLSFGGEWKVLGFKASVREVHDGTRMPGTKASVREVHEGTGDSRGLDAETESRGPSCGIRP